MTTRGSRQVKIAVDKAIRRHHLGGYEPSQVYDAIKDEFGEKNIPTLRTVQRICQDITTRDTSAPWSMATEEPGDVRDVLDVLAAIVMESDGRVSYVTDREASWITRIRRAAPTVDPLTVYQYAHDYMLREDARQDAADLDFSLALAPALADAKFAVRHAVLHARLWPDRTFSPLANHTVAVKAWAKERGLSKGATGGLVDVVTRIAAGNWPPTGAKKKSTRKLRRKEAKS